MALVVPLDRANASSIAAVGGKALNLGILTAAGFPVPPGFVITTEAYGLAVADRVEALLAGEGAVDAGTAGALRTVVLEAPVPEVVVREVLRAYAEIGPDVPVAVRSSATAEDLASASFAGQQDTYLNV